MGRPAKHGGWAAVRALTNGEEFKGLAAEAELAVMDDLKVDGAVAMFTKKMARLVATGDMFWAAFQTAVDEKDLKAMETYGRLVAWMYPAAFRVWGDLRKAEAQKVVDVKQLLKELRGHDDSA